MPPGQMRQGDDHGFLTHQELADWAKHYAGSQNGNDQQSLEWLVFALRRGETRANHFALPMNQIDEIAVFSAGISIPHPSPSVLGVFNLRSQMVSLFDLAELLGLGQTATHTAEQRLLIFDDQEGRRIAFLIHAVVALAQLDARNIQERTAADGDGFIRSIADFNHQNIGLLDRDTLLSGARQRL